MLNEKQTMLIQRVAQLAVTAFAISVFPGCVPYVINVPGSTQKVCQLSGEYDLGQPPPNQTTNRTESRAKLRGTYLGICFAVAFGITHFLFGDSISTHDIERPDGSDTIAFATNDGDPENCVPLTFFRASDRSYQWPRVPSFNLGIFETPTGGFFSNGTPYVTFSTAPPGVPPPSRSILTRYPGAFFLNDNLSFEFMYDLSPTKLLSLSAVPIDDTWHTAREPTKGLLFGTGQYRKSTDVYLAYLSAPGLERPYWYSGPDRTGQPQWSWAEDHAVSVFDRPGPPCLGELSVTWNRFLGRWLMLYQCASPRGVFFVSPVHGTVARPTLLFAPWLDRGYCYFMHARDGCPPDTPNPKDDLVIRPDGQDDWGGEYAAYVIDAYSTGDESTRTTTIFFTMSTWNPYQVILMRSKLAERWRFMP
jgi:hypothetical protein